MKSVLVIDDDAHIRRLVRIVLLSAGFDVKLAADGKEALEVLEQDPPDAVVLDVNMPFMDGKEVFSRMSLQGRRPPVLILSANQAAKVQREIGAEASLEKPFSPDEMIRKISRLTEDAVAA